MTTTPIQERNSSTVKSFAVLELLGQAGVPMALSDIARATDLNKTTARRFLATLCDLGYVERLADGTHRLTARVLDLSSMYFRTTVLPTHAMPHLERFCRETHTSTSLAILDRTETVYTAHVSEREALSVGVQIGTRLPAHATAVGKVLLSHLATTEVQRLYADHPLTAYTSRTITSLPDLIGALGEVRRQGFAVGEEEYEPGVRGAACAMTSADGSVIGAMNVSVRTENVPRVDFYSDILPRLLRTAYDITADAAGNPPAGTSPHGR